MLIAHRVQGEKVEYGNVVDSGAVQGSVHTGHLVAAPLHAPTEPGIRTGTREY